MQANDDEKASSGSSSRLSAFDGISAHLFIGWRARFSAKLRQIRRRGHSELPAEDAEGILPNTIVDTSLYAVIDEAPAQSMPDGSTTWTSLQRVDQAQLYDIIVEYQHETSPLHPILLPLGDTPDCGTRAWYLLNEQFASRMEEAIGIKVSEATNLRKRPDESLADYANRSISIFFELRSLGSPIADTQAVINILGGLPASMDTTISFWRTTIADRRRSGLYEGGTRSGIGDLYGLLRTEHIASRHRETREAGSDATEKKTIDPNIQALTAKVQECQTTIAALTKQLNKRGKGGVSKFRGDCHRCGRPGHRKADCFAKTDKDGKKLTDKTADDKRETSDEDDVNLAIANAFVCITEAGVLANIAASRASLAQVTEGAVFILDTGASRCLTPYRTDIERTRKISPITVRHDKCFYVDQWR